MCSSTAILLFAQPVANDATSKPLSARANANYRALTLLNGRVRQTALAAGLPVLFSTDLIAHVGSFGEQLSGAIGAAFGQGFERVLVVGNDCPALTTADLTHAATELQTGRVVLGPDARGGVYLLGLTRKQFAAGLLRELPWQTTRIFRAIQSCFAAHSVLILRRLNDINRFDDLRNYRRDTHSIRAFLSVLLRLLSSGSFSFYQPIAHRSAPTNVYRTGPLRAPPFLLTLLPCR